ncbi:MAG: ATP-binding protein [Leifsonia sp.]
MTTGASAPSTSSQERLRTALPNGEATIPLSERRIRIVLARATAFFGLLFVVQTIPVMLRQIPELISPWSYLLGVTILGCIAVVVVSAIIDPGRRVVFGIFAIVYLVAVLLWPFVVGNPDDFAADTPWIWYLVTVATTNAAIAFPLPVAVIYTVVTPLCYGIIRVTPAGGDVGLMRASLDTVYAILLSFAALIIYTTLRAAAEAVDAAQAGALAKYAGAVRQHATDVERVQVDAIVHDSVLTTLLSAAGADTVDQRRLAARMAQTALEHLDSAADPVPEDVGDVSLDRLTRRIRSSASAFSAPFVIRASRIGDHGIPVHAAEALYSAAVQAMVNSMQHADRPGSPVRRRLTVTAPAGGCRIVVSDTGRGFDADGIPHERLGIRVSIIERMQSVGGSASIESAPGVGTTITLEWPAAPPLPAQTTEDDAA